MKELSQVNDIRGGELPKVWNIQTDRQGSDDCYLSGSETADCAETETRRQLPREESHCVQWPRHGQHHLHQHHLQGRQHGSGLHRI